MSQDRRDIVDKLGLSWNVSGQKGHVRQGRKVSGQKRLVNPRRACASRITAVILCVCVCLSVTLILANQAIRHPTKGSSDFSYIFLKKAFSIKMLCSEVMV